MIDSKAINILLDMAVNRTDKTEKLLKIINRFKEDDWRRFLNTAKIHQIQPLIFSELQNIEGLTVPEEIKNDLAKSAESIVLQYYSIFSFTTFVGKILEEEKIKYYVLKGITLNSLYRSEELRCVTDADIYVPDKRDFKNACAKLESAGFRPMKVMVEHNLEYIFTLDGRDYILELHSKPSAEMRNKRADMEIKRIYKKLDYKPDYYFPMGVAVPALGTDEYALHLILHMMQHFIGSGFGLKMLCDWMTFLNEKGGSIDEHKFTGYLKKTGTEKFAWAVTRICSVYLGFSPKNAVWMEGFSFKDDNGSLDGLYSDILSGGVFGKEKNSRMLIITGNRKIIEYAKIVHRQTCLRFPKLKKTIVLFPFLWCASIAMFIYNNKYLRNVKTKDVLKNADDRSAVFREFGLFRRD